MKTLRSRLIYAIWTASWANWRDTISWLGYNVLGSFMPIWGSFFLLKLRHQAFHWADFMRHGEFALYTAAFLAPALQLIVRNIRDSRYVLGTGSVLAAVFGLLVSAIIYSGVVTSSPTLGQSATLLDEPFLFAVSLLLFPVSLGFAAIVTLMERQIVNPNVEEIEQSSQRDLAERFAKKIGEGNAGQ